MKRTALKFNRKPNVELLLRENVGKRDRSLDIKVGSIAKKWENLFRMFFAEKYTVSGKERGQIRQLCSEHQERTVTAAMVAMFTSYMTEDWYLSRSMVPCLPTFASRFDRWKSKGYAIQKFMNGGKRWWLVNKAELPVEDIPSGVFRTEKEKGRVFVFRAKDGRLVKQSWLKKQ